MSKIQIITDSASDISKEMEQKYNLDVISYSIVIGDKTYTSRVDFDNEGCYELMEASESLISSWIIINLNKSVLTGNNTPFWLFRTHRKCHNCHLTVWISKNDS